MENIREAKRSLFNGGDYRAVKDAVIKAVEKTEKEKFKAYQEMQLGDRKPSESWADLIKLIPQGAQDFQDLMMKQKFLSMVGTDVVHLMTNDTLALANGLYTVEIEEYMKRWTTPTHQVGDPKDQRITRPKRLHSENLLRRNQRKRTRRKSRKGLEGQKDPKKRTRHRWS